MRTAGRLKELAKIQRPIRERNGSGGFKTTGYEDVVSKMYCDVKQLVPSTDVIASKAVMLQPFQFTCRLNPEVVIQIGDSIVWRERKFSILGFNWDINRTTLTITAAAENNNTSNGTQGS